MRRNHQIEHRELKRNESTVRFIEKRMERSQEPKVAPLRKRTSQGVVRLTIEKLQSK